MSALTLPLWFLFAFALGALLMAIPLVSGAQRTRKRLDTHCDELSAGNWIQG